MDVAPMSRRIPRRRAGRPVAASPSPRSRTRSIRDAVRGALFLAAMTAVSACGGGDRIARSPTLVVGVRQDFGGFNPITNSDLYTGELINFALYTPLVQYDENLEVVPNLARYWEEEGDTAIVFHLRGDVTWHDGEPVTASDVAFTFERAKDPVAASLLGSVFLANVASVEVLDSLTLRFRYARPHAQALEDFWWAPVPEHLLRDVAAAELRNAPFNRAPVGSGPFRLTEWRAGDRLVLEANPAYPAGLGGPPATNRIVLRIIPESFTLLTELITGTVDVDIPVLPDQMAGIEADTALRARSYPGRTVYYVGWNNARPPFDDARVRRALALAIDRNAIIEGLLYGEGTPAMSPVPPWSPVYPADLQPLAHDPAESGRLLEEAGWIDRDGDGVREDPEGRPLRFTLLSADDQLRRSVIEVLQRQLAAAGADAQIRTVEFQTMIGAHRSRDFDAIFTNWILDNFQVAAAPFALFHSSEADKPGSANRSTVRDTVIDRLVERGATATDASDQRQVWRELTLRLQETQPLTFMFWLNELAAYRAAVSDVTMDPRGEFLSIARWSIQP